MYAARFAAANYRQETDEWGFGLPLAFAILFLSAITCLTMIFGSVPRIPGEFPYLTKGRVGQWNLAGMVTFFVMSMITMFSATSVITSWVAWGVRLIAVAGVTTLGIYQLAFANLEVSVAPNLSPVFGSILVLVVLAHNSLTARPAPPPSPERVTGSGLVAGVVLIGLGLSVCRSHK